LNSVQRLESFVTGFLTCASFELDENLDGYNFSFGAKKEIGSFNFSSRRKNGTYWSNLSLKV